MKKLLLSIFITTALTGCFDSGHDDIKLWMKKQDKELKGKIELLPPAKSYTPVVFKAQTDPFVIKEKFNVNDLVKDRYAPDFNREKEYLEDYALETLKMIGTVIKDGKFYAMIRDPNKGINYVTISNYLGKDYGKIVSITEGEILLEERINNGEAWIIRNKRIELYEGMAKK